MFIKLEENCYNNRAGFKCYPITEQQLRDIIELVNHEIKHNSPAKPSIDVNCFNGDKSYITVTFDSTDIGQQLLVVNFINKNINIMDMKL